MDGSELVRNLVKLLSDLPGLNVVSSGLSRMGRVYQLDGYVNGLIYIKAIAHPPHHWGITENTVHKIKHQRKPWCVILLYDSSNTGYVISSVEYDKRSDGLWPDAQGDYKISSGKSLVGIPKFRRIDELLTILSKVLRTS